MIETTICSAGPQTVSVEYGTGIAAVLQPGAADPEAIMRRVAERHGMTPAAICGHGRQRRFVRARWDAMAELRAAGLSLKEIGFLLGQRCHTTICHGLKNHARLIAIGDKKEFTSIATSDKI